MTAVWILVCICVNQPRFIGATSVNTDAIPFDSAEHCLESLPQAKSYLESTCTETYVTCRKQTVLQDVAKNFSKE